MKKTKWESRLKEILFVTWDGPQTNYLEGLFLPIFERLAHSGMKFHVLQFTWGDLEKIEARKKACNKIGITYQCEMVRRHPVAIGGLFSAIKGAYLIRRAIRRYGIDLVMPRSTLPALATLLALRGSSLPIIFDADGLPLDERVDFSGHSASSFSQRLLRDVESQAVRRADLVLTRSLSAVRILQARGGAGTSHEKFHVVSNGRDEVQYSPGIQQSRIDARIELCIPLDAPLVVYSGSIGPQYCLDEMLAIFGAVRHKALDAHMLVLTGDENKVIAAISGLPPEVQRAITVRSVSSTMVPDLLASGDVGLALRRESFSMQAVSPIKIGEYLLCGLPVMVTGSISSASGASERAEHVLVDLTPNGIEKAASWFVDFVMPSRDILREDSRAAGKILFSLATSVAAYRKALLEVLE